jgi:hypothetical protein
MFAEERSAILENRRRASRRSRQLVVVAHTLRATAAEARATNNRLRRERRALHISGGSTDGSHEQVILQRLANGLLPWTKARKTVWGRGEGNRCAVCEQAISPREAEVMAHFEGAPAFTFHARCFDAWRRASA